MMFYGITKINSSWKSQAIIDELFPALKGIVYNKDPKKGKLYYTSSRPNVAKSYSQGILLKYYEYEGEENIIDKIIPMLAVDFVRMGQWTVYPFPFKILREAMLADYNYEEK